jgi:NADH:ubiquinone oxidoreductase subunit 3 (subunit A)
VDAELLNAVVIVLAIVVIAGLPVLLVVRYFSLRRRVSIKDSGPLSEAERRGLKAWARRTKVAFAGAMLFVVLNGVLLIVTNPAPLWLGWLGLGAGIVIVVVGLAIHFSGRCPRCGYIIGFQSALLLPYRCERCKTPFR